MYRIVNKVLVAKFYEQNTGLLLFVFFLMFGIVESGQLVSFHLSLIRGMLSSVLITTLICGIWAIYLLRAQHFFQQALHKPENTFLIELARLPSQKRVLLLVYLQCFVYLPVLVYSAVILGVAFTTHQWISLLTV